jgi:hypothetical protein
LQPEKTLGNPRPETNCSLPEHHYSGQSTDLVIETIGVLLHIIAIVLAIQLKKKLARAKNAYKAFSTKLSVKIY